MSQSQPKKHQNYLNLLVFKDNLKARSFIIPLRWFTEIGILLSVVIAVSILAIFMAVKYYIAYSKTDASLVTQMESTIEKLNTEINEIKKSKIETVPAKPLSELNQSEQVVASGLFYSFPNSILPPPASNQLSIEMQNPKTSWKGNQLIVDYDLTFVGNQTSSQQGRILIIARGPGFLRVHPDTAMMTMKENHLFDPNLGEYFSVSRFRKGQITFDVPEKATITGVQIFVFGNNKNLLFTKGLIVPERN